MTTQVPSIRVEQFRVLSLLMDQNKPMTPEEIARRLNWSYISDAEPLTPQDVEATIAALMLRKDLRELIKITTRPASNVERESRLTLNLGVMSAVVVLTACSTLSGPAELPTRSTLTYFEAGVTTKLDPGDYFHPFFEVQSGRGCNEMPCLGPNIVLANSSKTLDAGPKTLAAYFADDTDRSFPVKPDTVVAQNSADLSAMLNTQPSTPSTVLPRLQKITAVPPIALTSLLTEVTTGKLFQHPAGTEVSQNARTKSQPPESHHTDNEGGIDRDTGVRVAQSATAQGNSSTSVQDLISTFTGQPKNGPPPSTHGDVKRMELRKTSNTVASQVPYASASSTHLSPTVTKLAIEPITFANNSDILDDSSVKSIERIAEAVQSAEAIHLRGRVGFRHLNYDSRRLALGRALAVRRVLVEAGVPESKIRILHPRNNDFLNATDPSDPVNRSVTIDVRNSAASSQASR